MKLKISTVVHDELLESYTYYKETTNSGDSFLKDYNDTLDRIEEYPYHYQLINDAEYRRCNFSKFSHCVLYKIMEDHVFVFALVHQRRKPRY